MERTASEGHKGVELQEANTSIGHQGSIDNIIGAAFENRVVSAVAAKLTPVIGNQNLAPTMLARLASSCPPFERCLVSAVNCGAHTGEPMSFTSSVQALGFIGVDHARDIYVASGIETILRSLTEGTSVSAKELMAHSLATAAGCGKVAEIHGQDRCDYFLSGLCHNIGVAVMAYGLKGDYGVAFEMVNGTPVQLHAIEMRQFGFDHQEVGAAVLAALGFPAICVASAEHHHESGFLAHPVLGAVRLCSGIAHQVGCSLGIGNMPPDVPPHTLTDLGLHPEDADSIVDEVASVAGRSSRLAA